MSPEDWGGTGLEVLHASDFEGEHLKRTGLYAVCFAATWCPPTRRFVPKFVAQRGKLAAQLAIADITAMEDPLWDSFHIDITPTMVLFREGVAVARFDGRPILALGAKDLNALAKAVNAQGAGASPPSGAAPGNP